MFLGFVPHFLLLSWVYHTCPVHNDACFFSLYLLKYHLPQSTTTDSPNCFIIHYHFWTSKSDVEKQCPEPLPGRGIEHVVPSSPGWTRTCAILWTVVNKQVRSYTPVRSKSLLIASLSCQSFFLCPSPKYRSFLCLMCEPFEKTQKMRCIKHLQSLFNTRTAKSHARSWRLANLEEKIAFICSFWEARLSGIFCFPPNHSCIPRCKEADFGMYHHGYRTHSFNLWVH